MSPDVHLSRKSLFPKGMVIEQGRVGTPKVPDNSVQGSETQDCDSASVSCPAGNGQEVPAVWLWAASASFQVTQNPVATLKSSRSVT